MPSEPVRRRFAGGDLLVPARPADHDEVAAGEGESATGGEPSARQIGHEVAEPVDVRDPADGDPPSQRGADRQPERVGDLRAERGGVEAASERRRHRREPVPAVKGRAGRRQVEIVARDRVHGAGREQMGEQPVVGGDEPLAVSAQDEPAPGTADPGIDDREMHGPGRKSRGRGREDERRGLHVAGREVVAEVDDPGLRREAEQRPLDRPDVVVAGSEVGKQGDRPHGARMPDVGGSCVAAFAQPPAGRNGVAGAVAGAPASALSAVPDHVPEAGADPDSRRHAGGRSPGDRRASAYPARS